MPELPRGTVTFLFTDIEGSTRLWQRHPQAMESASARHDTLLREAVSAHGGVVYKVIGDALQVAFPTAPQAMNAALEAQLALTREDWSLHGQSERLRVRMGLHTGAVDPDPDGDYRSPVLNRLGRLLGAGHGGQVLISGPTMMLVRDRVPEGVSLQDLGAHRLKDLLEPEPVHQLVHPDLTTDFPPLVTLDARPHNLPRQPTPFLGREQEVGQLVALLAQQDTQLVTLTGPGGTGKTRLALQAAAEVVEQFTDGIWFVDLSPLSDPALVSGAIAEVLGVRESGGTPLVELLQGHLRERHLLLVLDNLEQLLPEAASNIGTLLSTSPGLTVLATSRVPLRLRAEREVPVPPLGLPRRKPPPTVVQLGQYEAVRLFIERAKAVRPDFGVTDANAPAIAEICHRLDGLPLAIELATARIRMLPPEAMLTRLQTRLTMLTGGARDLPERQRTLRGAIAWSYELLSSEEQALFRRLSVFAGGATLEAIEAVAAGNELGLDVFEGLERLVEHSLVRQTETEGEPRFTMLETIREYGLDQLEQSGEAEEAHSRHAAFYLAFAEEADSAIKGGTELRAWLDRLEAEHDNQRGALGWALVQDPETALRLAGALGDFWSMRGHLSEGRSLLAHALAVGPSVPSPVRALALKGAAYLALTQRDLRQMTALAEQHLAIGRELDDPDTIQIAQNSLALAAYIGGDLERASMLFENGLATARARGDQYAISLSLGNLGIVVAQQGDIDRATALTREALGISRGLTELRGAFAVLYDLVNLGNLRLARQDWTGAATLLGEVLELVVTMGLKESVVGEALSGLGIMAGWQGWHEQAARLFGAADGLIERLGAFLDPVLPEMVEHAITATRQALGEEAYAVHHAAGAALSLDEAIAEAVAVKVPAEDKTPPLI